jgi:thioredoxin 1
VKYLTREHWRPIIALNGSILAVTFFVSCQSSESLPGIFPSAGQSTSSKGEMIAMKTSQATTTIEHINAGDFDRKVLQSEVPVLVDFYADWCGPCKALAPVLEELAGEIPNAKIVKINVDENYELATRYKIDSIPSLLVFKGSELTARHVGLANKAVLQRLITR